MDWDFNIEPIIKEHQKDFYNGNYMSVVTDFWKYVKDLGGIFSDSYEGKTNTVQEFRKRTMFVQGLIAIWKFCYYNGSTWWYFMNSADKSFYHSPLKKANSGSIAQLCTGDGGRSRTTNCNYGIDTLSKFLGYSIWSVDFKKMISQGAKIITKKEDLKPGDLVHMFSTSLDRSNPTTWKDWKHIAIVYEKDGKDLWLADFGSRFIKTGKPLHRMLIDDSSKAGGDYNFFWSAIRYMDLTEEDTVTDNAIQMFAEITREWDKFKDIPDYDKVLQVYTEYVNNEKKWLDDASNFVLDGKAGSGEERKKFFGSEYDKVQDRVNYIVKMAYEVIAGTYGSGEVRKKALGDDYDIIQREVNRLLR